jgi:hypothetical protein
LSRPTELVASTYKVSRRSSQRHEPATAVDAARRHLRLSGRNHRRLHPQRRAPRDRCNLGSGLAGQQWLANAYLLSLGSLILLGGSLGDAWGERRVFTIGIAAFGAFSPETAVMFALSRRAGALADRFGPRLFMGVGPLLAAAGMFLSQGFSASSSSALSSRAGSAATHSLRTSTRCALFTRRC